MLTTAPKPDKKMGPFDPVGFLKDAAPVSFEFLEDYLWGKRFGQKQKEGMVWKYGNPWLYPKHEFEMLKTMLMAEDAVVLLMADQAHTAKADIAAALNVPEAQKEQARKLSQGMMAHFSKGPVA